MRWAPPFHAYGLPGPGLGEPLHHHSGKPFVFPYNASVPIVLDAPAPLELRERKECLV